MENKKIYRFIDQPEAYISFILKSKKGIARLDSDTECYVKRGDLYNDVPISANEAIEKVKGLNIGGFTVIVDDVINKMLRYTINGISNGHILSEYYSPYQFQDSIINCSRIRINDVSDISDISIVGVNMDAKIKFFLYENHIEEDHIHKNSLQIFIKNINNGNVLEDNESLFYINGHPDPVKKEEFLSYLNKEDLCIIDAKVLSNNIIGNNISLIIDSSNTQTINLTGKVSAYQFSSNCIEISDFVSIGAIKSIEVNTSDNKNCSLFLSLYLNK